MKLSIIIPAYNEQDRIQPSLAQYASYYEARGAAGVEILVVVNGSTDRTEEVARAFAAVHPVIRVLVEPRKVGKGGAILIGFKAAAGDVVGFTDADASTPPAAFQDLVDHLGPAGAIIATRWHPDSKVWPLQTFRRRVASRLFNGVVEVLFGLGIRDTQCGAKIFHREAIQRVLPHIGVTRWAFDVDLLFQLNRAGYRIIEWPTTWHDAGGSRLRLGRASLEMFVALIRLRILYSPLRGLVAIYDRTVGRFVHPTP